MSKMILIVSTDKVGSEQEVDLGYTQEEWDNLRHSDQDVIVNEKIWEAINVHIVEK